MDSRARMMLDALNLPSALQQSQQLAQPMRYAEGGVVGGLPSLADLSRSDFDWSSMGKFNPAPSSFTPMTQDAPMFVAQAPAYGSAGTNIYDWQAPIAGAAGMNPYNWQATSQTDMQAEQKRLEDEAMARQAEEQRLIDESMARQAEEQRKADAAAAEKVQKEQQERSGLVSQAYKDILGREADAEGLAYWANSGQDMDTIRSNIQRSPEAAALTRTQTATQTATQPPPQKELTLDRYGDAMGSEYGNLYYQNLKNAQRLQSEGRRPDISEAQFAEARRLSEQMDKGIYGPDSGYVNPEGGSGSSWYAGDSG